MAVPQPREPDDAVVLSEPARQQLVSIAADLVGRMAPDELPVALRPVAASLAQVSKPDIIERSIANFRKADSQYGDQVATAVKSRRESSR